MSAVKKSLEELNEEISTLFDSPLRQQETVENRIDQMLALSAEKEKIPQFVGGSMVAIQKDIRYWAKKRKPILFIGAPGTGKGLAAKIAADAAGLELNKITLSTLKGEMAYSDLFGHEKGAFTGATELKRGALEQSGGKLCFLDELGTSDDVQIQKALLAFLEDKTIKRRGGEHKGPIEVDTY